MKRNLLFAVRRYKTFLYAVASRYHTTTEKFPPRTWLYCTPNGIINKQMVRQYLSPALGKFVQQIASLRGGGSALPGLIVEKTDPRFITRTLDQLPLGVVIVSGTNGKTTTTKIVAELLEGQGLKVFTNSTGSNFVRGVIAALLRKVSLSGKLDADIAILELDEAHAIRFIQKVPPAHCLLLNVMRDQLDRFGEIDYTAQLLKSIAVATTVSVTLNREDWRVREIAKQLGSTVSVQYFGVSDELKLNFPSDDELYGDKAKPTSTAVDVELTKTSDGIASFTIDGVLHSTEVAISGAYNLLNAAAALATVRQVLGKKTNTQSLISTLSGIAPAFGRGETISVGGQPLDIILVKNPSGFQQALTSFSSPNHATMLAINDKYADGRDVSWLWDVSFESLRKSGVSHIAGSRAYDMALRLLYDDIPYQHVAPDVIASLTEFISSHPGTPKRIYCTYTAMLAIHKELSDYTQEKGLKS